VQRRQGRKDFGPIQSDDMTIAIACCRDVGDGDLE
jgi:hypothetical protein